MSEDQFDNSEWDGSAVKSTLSIEDLRKVCIMDLNGYSEQDEPIKDLCKLPIKKTPDSKVNINALKAAGSGSRGIGAVKKPDEVPEEYFSKKRKAAANRIASLWKQAFNNQAPENVLRIASEVKPETDVEKILAGLGFYTSSNDDSVMTLREEINDIHRQLDIIADMVEKVYSMTESVFDLSQYG